MQAEPLHFHEAGTLNFFRDTVSNTGSQRTY